MQSYTGCFLIGGCFYQGLYEGVGAASGPKCIPGLYQFVSDSVFKLFGRRVGECQDQNLIDLQLQLQDQPNKETFNVVGLARTGAGFYQIAPFKGSR